MRRGYVWMLLLVSLLLLCVGCAKLPTEPVNVVIYICFVDGDTLYLPLNKVLADMRCMSADDLAALLNGA
jgi:hypothetical protein